MEILDFLISLEFASATQTTFVIFCHKNSVYNKVKLHAYHKMFSFIRGEHLFVMTFILVAVAHVDEKGCNSLLVTVL